jgi:hypothetical protein
MIVRSRFSWKTTAAVTVVMFYAIAMSAAPAPHYLITNNDASFSTSLSGNSATFYTIMHNGLLKETAVVNTGRDRNRWNRFNRHQARQRTA